MTGSLTPITNRTLTFDQLQERFPRTAELFRASPRWRPNKKLDIAHQLVQFLDSCAFEVVCVHVLDRDTDEHIGFEPIVKIKGRNADIGGQWFPDLEHARLHALEYVLDIFEVEQQIKTSA
jgi:hypothetical protein